MLVRPLFEYNFVIRSANAVRDIDTVESVQRLVFSASRHALINAASGRVHVHVDIMTLYIMNVFDVLLVPYSRRFSRNAETSSNWNVG